MALLEIEKLSVSGDGASILKDISFVVNPGEVLAIVGPNGAGKTTLLRSIIGMPRGEESGVIRFEGRLRASFSPRALARLVGYVPQQLAATFPYSVQEFVEMSLYSWEEIPPEAGSLAHAVSAALACTESSGLSKRKLPELSGGEWQRVLVAAAIVQNPRVLILDEPAAALDPSHARTLYKLLSKLVADRSVAVVMVSHDINAAARHCSRIVALKSGELVFDGAPASFVTSPILEELYAVEFDRIPTLDHPGCVLRARV